MYYILQMIKEIVDEKQQIIDHIEQKLAMLRQQRAYFEKQKYSAVNTQPCACNPIHEKAVKGTALQKLELENNLNKLQQLYEAKKELQQAGIETNNPAQIHKYRNDPKWANYVQGKKKKVAEDRDKKKIVDEEMQKAKQFLSSKKVAQKELKGLQIMNYRNMFKQKQKQLQQYDRLVNKRALTRIQKQELIEMTFKLLKDSRNSMTKDLLRNFLLANPQFCSHFYITHAEINRDLKVFETKQGEKLDEREFYEFIKSIQVTNPGLNPSLNRKKYEKQKKEFDMVKIDEKQNKKEEGKLNDRQLFRKMLQYLRKLFKNMDRSNQSIIERSKFIIAMEKGLYIDDKSKTFLDNIKDLAKYITTKTKQQCAKDYYKELQAKYINFPQVEANCREYCAKLNKTPQNHQPPQQNFSNQHQQAQQGYKQKQQSQNEYEKQSEPDSQINLSSKQGKIITQQDYKRYGWKNQTNHHQMGIQEIDKYYNSLGQKYQTEIQWNGFNLQTQKDYKQGFKELEAFIKLQDQKNKVSPHKHP